MGLLKFLIALGLFVLFAPVVLFSIGAVVVAVWSVFTVLLPFILPIILVLFLGAVFAGIVKGELEYRKSKRVS